jgi:hypothetical protein
MNKYNNLSFATNKEFLYLFIVTTQQDAFTHNKATEFEDCLFVVLQDIYYSVLVKVLCYKPEGRGFDTRCGDF